MEQLLTNVSAVSGPRLSGLRDEDFEEIFRENRRKVFRVLIGLTHDVETAADLTQECFLRAFRSKNTFRHDATVTTWLLKIAVNLAREHGRRPSHAFWRRLFKHREENALEALDVATAADSPEVAVVRKEQLAAIWKAVECLPQQQREVFTLRFLNDMSLSEIAFITGTAVGTVKSHLSRGLGSIRSAMRSEFHN